MDNYKITISLFVLLAVHNCRAVLTNNTGKKNAEIEPGKIKTNFKTIKIAQDRISSFPHDKFSLPKFNYDINYNLASSEFGNYRPKKFAPRLELSTLNSLPFSSTNVHNLFRKPGPSYTLPSFSLPGSRHPGFNSWRTGFKSPHTPTIPISLEAYGPPNKPALPSFSIGSSSFIQNSNHHHGSFGSTQNGFFANDLGQLSSQSGIHAPPTQPDIKYDGWQPIAGNIAPPNFHDSGKNAPPNFHNSGNIVPPNFHDSGSSPTNSGSSNAILNPEFVSGPSNSYGEPIYDVEDHDLKQSVRQRDELALPPPPLPETEPFHVQGQPQTSLPSNHAPEPVGPAPEPTRHAPGPAPGPHPPINVQEQVDSYLVPPPSSFSSDGPYPSARRPLPPPKPEFGFIRPPNFSRSPARSQGPSQPTKLFAVSLTPPRAWAPVQFRQADTQSNPTNNFGSYGEASEFYNNYNVLSQNFPQDSANCIDKPHQGLSDSDVSMSYNQIVVSEDSRANKITTDSESGLTGLDGSENNNYDGGLNDEDERSVIANNQVEPAIGQSSALGAGTIDYGQLESLTSSNINHQFKSEALAQTLPAANDADGFQIQGSKGVYTLQIQPADGSHGTENSDGSIRHDQVLSDGLLQNILAAIEQPGDNNHSGGQSIYQPQISGSFDLNESSSSSVLSTVADHLAQIKSTDNKDIVPLTDKSEAALFSDKILKI
ncbi:uncharacterized protein LOC103572266 [Microplitis demolitor]|uniref:uncharacterized protein LOC103572266 n=1 Tax=Microplitis demolitor TaxID=69319 RepID=UPI0004CD68F6|nr:uncharacterized protein LOC103572266 [Microplitis demolitor]